MSLLIENLQLFVDNNRNLPPVAPAAVLGRHLIRACPIQACSLETRATRISFIKQVSPSIYFHACLPFKKKMEATLHMEITPSCVKSISDPQLNDIVSLSKTIYSALIFFFFFMNKLYTIDLIKRIQGTQGKN